MSRVLSASERTIDFSSPYTTDYEAMSDAEKKYRKLREMISNSFAKIDEILWNYAQHNAWRYDIVHEV